tara:strand:+ start:1985 stop:2170 length:186 start_codon:yes stop_codon:yes gene_type:complete
MNIARYLKSVQAELKHVAWPTQKTTFYFTLIVVVVSLLIAAYLGVFDFIFNLGIEEIITNY